MGARIITGVYEFGFKGQTEKSNSVVPAVILDPITGEPLGDYSSWGLTPGTKKEITYYSGVEANNPSGSKNIKNIILISGTTTVLTQLLSYDNDDDIISIESV